MSQHAETGKRGEALARSFLEDRGYHILHTNWRAGQLEIDIIAVRDRVLHLVEVKTQHAITAGLPEDNVDRRKMMNMLRAGEAYLARQGNRLRVQYDIISVTLLDDGHDIFLMEDVYL